MVNHRTKYYNLQILIKNGIYFSERFARIDLPFRGRRLVSWLFTSKSYGIAGSASISRPTYTDTNLLTARNRL